MPTVHIEADGEVRLDTTDNTNKYLKVIEDGGIAFSDISELGDINFTGTISAEGNAGVTGSRVVGDKRLTFTNGLLTGFEDA